MIAPSGGFGAWGTSRGNGVLYITFRRTRTASLGLKRWPPPRFGRHGRAELPQHRKVVEHPDAAAIGPDDQIVVMDGDVVVLRDGQVQHQRLPVIAIIERDVHRALRAGEQQRSEEHTSELQSPCNLVCRLLLE